MIFNELMTGLNEAVGMESISDAPMTELEEMNAEIQDMIALESALDEEFAYNTLAFCDNTEATNALLAMRECGLESTQGMDPAKIYEGFGIESEIAMEAAKDVLARKAYAGVAAIKALIATCIKWLKSLFGVTVASKKVFASLAKKAKESKKQLSKKRGSAKIDSEKLVRELPDYAAGLTANMKVYDDCLAAADLYGNGDEVIKVNAQTYIDDTKDLDERISKLNESYNKSETTEASGSALVTTIITKLGELEKLGTDNKSVDAGKKINKAIKALEKYRSELDKKTSEDDKQLSEKKASINKAIVHLNKANTGAKTTLKNIVKIADDLLTMSKGVLAAIY